MAADLTTLQRLLRYPHGVFDKRPSAELAIRIRHVAGCRWSVADEVLTLVVGVSSQTHTYDLTGRTLVQLSMDLVADGFDVVFLSSTLRTLSAAVLVEGSGDQDTSNGDHLNAYTSLLWVVLSAYAREIREAGYQKEQALRQMVIPQAEGYWLDVWGSIYGIGRMDDELDSHYAPRIPEEAFRIRVNALAIEKAILDVTGKDVRIREPWKNIFTLNESQLSGGDYLYDGANYGYHLIEPVASSPIDWADVLPVIERNRPAGVQVVSPRVAISRWVIATLNGRVWVGGRSSQGGFASALQNYALGWMKLDDDEGLVRNYRASMIASVYMTNRVGRSWKQAGGKWDSRKWRDRDVVSDLTGTVVSWSSEVRGSLVSAGPDFGIVYNVILPPDVSGHSLVYDLPATAESASQAMQSGEVGAAVDGSASTRGRAMPGAWKDGGTWQDSLPWGGVDVPTD